jgi:imidazolonepropionase-like amidohydrolase
MKIKLIALCLITHVYVLAQNSAPAPKQTKSVLLLNGFLHIGNGKTIANSAIGFKNGIIDLVADATSIKLKSDAYDTVIQLSGKHIYPGFIGMNSTLGLTEVDAVRATLDFAEVGTLNPHIRALIAFNAESKINFTVRTNGILYVQATPRGGLISGSSSVVALDAWNWEDAVLKVDDGIHLNFPKLQVQRSFMREENKSDISTQYELQMNELKKFFTESKSYITSATPIEKNLRFEAMKGVFNGNQNLYIHTDYVKDIITALQFGKEYNIKKIVLVGARDAHKCSKEINAYGAAVMINRPHDLPQYSDEDIDQPYKQAAQLDALQTKFCIQNAGDMEAMNLRNLPFLAGTCIAYGLDKEKAVSAISLDAAKILGLDSQIGSVEEKKRATLFVSEGDALDMKTNKVVYAFIDGRSIQLINSQDLLSEKFKSKYGIK